MFILDIAWKIIKLLCFCVGAMVILGTFFGVNALLSGCTPVETAEAEEIAPDAYTVDCSEEGAICINNNPAYEVKSDGKVVGMINLQDGFIFNKYFRKTYLYNTGKVKWYNASFKDSDCKGTPYGAYPYGRSLGNLYLPVSHGEVFDLYEKIYYYPPGSSTIYQFERLSSYVSSLGLSTPGVCKNYGVGSTSKSNYLKLYPNDPAVTGIETYPFPSVEIVTPQPVLIIED